MNYEEMSKAELIEEIKKRDWAVLDQGINPEPGENSSAVSLFYKFVANSSQGLGWTTLDGSIFYLNPALSEMCEESSEDATGRHETS